MDSRDLTFFIDHDKMFEVVGPLKKMLQNVQFGGTSRQFEFVKRSPTSHVTSPQNEPPLPSLWRGRHHNEAISNRKKSKHEASSEKKARESHAKPDNNTKQS